MADSTPDLYDYFIPLETTSPEYTCWSLDVDGKILGSIVTSSRATKAEAWTKFRAKKKWESSFWTAVEAGDIDALARIVS